MKQIICLAGQPWSSSPGRTQQLLSRLRDTQVLYFSPAAGQLDRSYSVSYTHLTLPTILLV